MIEPMACSRMPKCSVRPYWWPGKAFEPRSSGRKLGSPSIVVLLLSARSAEPPHSSGSTGARALSTSPLALRVATPFSLASKLGSACAQPSGRRRDCMPLVQGHALGVRGGPGVVARLPRRVARPAALDDDAGVLQDVVGHGEGRVGVEAQDRLGGGDLVGAERAAVGLAGALLVRCRPADDRAQRDERRALGLGAGRLERRGERLDVLVVGAVLGHEADALHVPAVRLVARGDVLGEGDRGVVLDRDAVVVPDQDEVAQALGAGERRGLGADALLQVAVGADRPDRVVERRLAGGGVGVEQPALAAGGHRHADGVADALAERARWWSRRPGCGATSGWPGVSEPHWRRWARSSSVRP